MSFWNRTSAGGETFADRIRKAREHHPMPEVPMRTARPPRKPVFSAATLITANGRLPAVVTNLTALGARVDFTVHVGLQGDVVLVAPGLGLNCHVRVAWEHDGSAGLIFVKQDRV